MKLKEFLNEEFTEKTILINPSKQELLKYAKEIERSPNYLKKHNRVFFRFIVDQKNNLYLVNGHVMIHDQLERKMKKIDDEAKSIYNGYIDYYPETKKFKLFRHQKFLEKKNKYLKKLLEEFLNEEKDSLKTILVNPTKQEFLNLIREQSKYRHIAGDGDLDFKFIITTKGDLYLTSGWSLLHTMMMRKIKTIDKNVKEDVTGYLHYSPKRKLFYFLSIKSIQEKALQNKNMKKLIGSNLNEEKTESNTILVNPTKQELLKIATLLKKRLVTEGSRGMFFRFLIHKGKVYVASGNELSHYGIEKKIKAKAKDISEENDGYIFVNLKKRKIIVTGKNKDFIKNKYLNRLTESNLNENLAYVKFKYDNYHHDKVPRVKVIDTEYPGRPGQKTYGQRRDLLGWNINYVKNKRYAKRAIDDIESFAKLLSANKDEVYKRIKYFFPEQAKFIRRYMRKHIKGLKHKKGILWRRTSYPEIKAYNKEAF